MGCTCPGSGSFLPPRPRRLPAYLPMCPVLEVCLMKPCTILTCKHGNPSRRRRFWPSLNVFEKCGRRAGRRPSSSRRSTNMADAMFKEDAERLAEQIVDENQMVDIIDVKMDPDRGNYVIVAYDYGTDEEILVDGPTDVSA